MLQQTLLYILTFLSGLFFGSFYNLVSDRVPKGEKILTGRSKCDHCKKPLSPGSLIPVFSFLFQKGKCAFCKKKLTWYYPLSEILTGLMFVGVAYLTGIYRELGIPSLIGFLYMIVVGSFYIILLLTDLKYQLIPDKIVKPAIIFVISFIVINTAAYFITYYFQLKNDDFGKYLLEAGYFKLQIFGALKSLGMLFLSSAAISGFFWLLVFLTKGRGMGGGDIRLSFLIGLFNGFPYNIIAIFAGFILGAVVSVVLVLLRLRTLKDTVPFGPFLITGSIISILWGPYILNFYLNILNFR